jgi:hypothetical protein
VCDLSVLGVLQGGSYVIPATNPLTGNPVSGGAVAGQSATLQGPFQWAFYQYPNFNLARRETRVLNIDSRYEFGLDRVLGERAATWGSLGVRASAFFTRALDLYADGVTQSGKLAGSRDVPRWKTRTELTHRMRGLSNTLQWFYRTKTTDNRFVLPAQYPEQSPAFVNSDYSFLNHTGSYEVNDMITVRLTVNNLTDAGGPNGIFGDSYDFGVGREYLLGFSMRF